MQINPNSINNKPLFVTKSADQVFSLEQVAQVEINKITPQGHHYGPVSQLINSRYLYQLRRDIKKVLKGRNLQEFLEHDFSLEEFEELPESLKNLLIFDKKITNSEILQFIENFDNSHEISFKDYNFNRIKFRAIFAALGELLDVEMQAGANTYVPLAEDFVIKKKIKEVFVTLKDKIKYKLGLRKPNDQDESISLTA